MEEKIRIACSVCQASLRVRAATQARFAICPKCQARTPIPARDRVVVQVPSPSPGPGPVKEVTQADLAPVQGAEPVPEVTETPEASPQVEEPPAPEPVENVPSPDAGTETPPAQPSVEPAAEQPPADLVPPAAEEEPVAKPPTKGLPPKRGRTLPGRRPLPGKRGEGEGAPPKKGGSKLLIIVVFLVVLLGGGAGLYFSGILTGGKTGGSSQTPAAENVVDKAFAALKSKDVDGFFKLVKGGSEEDQNQLKDRIAALDSFAFEYEIKSFEGSKIKVEWQTTYKAKPSADPGGETEPKEQKYPPAKSADEIEIVQEGGKWLIPKENLPSGFPLPKN
jgi:hypothetical protein